VSDPYDPPPRSCIEFRLSIGAEDRDALVRALRSMADKIERDQEGPNGCWGGAGSHGDYTFDHDPSITPDDYRCDLEAWCERRREARRA
jgi:hypothetical protein